MHIKMPLFITVFSQLIPLQHFSYYASLSFILLIIKNCKSNSFSTYQQHWWWWNNRFELCRWYMTKECVKEFHNTLAKIHITCGFLVVLLYLFTLYIDDLQVNYIQIGYWVGFSYRTQNVRFFLLSFSNYTPSQINTFILL